MSNDKTAWDDLLAQAKTLTEKGTECAMCGGTGGPGISDFVVCKPCGGTGSSIPTSTTAQ